MTRYEGLDDFPRRIGPDQVQGGVYSANRAGDTDKPCVACGLRQGGFEIFLTGCLQTSPPTAQRNAVGLGGL